MAQFCRTHCARIDALLLFKRGDKMGTKPTVVSRLLQPGFAIPPWREEVNGASEFCLVRGQQDILSDGRTERACPLWHRPTTDLGRVLEGNEEPRARPIPLHPVGTVRMIVTARRDEPEEWLCKGLESSRAALDALAVEQPARMVALVLVRDNGLGVGPPLSCPAVGIDKYLELPRVSYDFGARNAGVAAAPPEGNELVGFLDADDVIHMDALKIAVLATRVIMPSPVMPSCHHDHQVHFRLLGFPPGLLLGTMLLPSSARM